MTPSTPTCFWDGQRIRLRPLSPDDLPTLAAAERDSEAIRGYEPGVFPLRTAADFESLLGHSHRFAVESLAGDLVGVANIRDVDQRNGTFSYAIRIYPDHQRHGYAKEAVTILLKYGFEELRCQKVNAITVEFNEGSIALHRALGFTEEGRLRRNVFTNGRYWDELCFGLTQEEFQATQADS